MPDDFFIYNNTGETQKVTKDTYQTFHTENYQKAQTPEEKKQATLDYLNGIRSTTNVILPGQLEMEAEAGNSYKDRLNDNQRVANIKSPYTELGKKKANALAVLGAKSEFQNKQDKYASKLIKKSNFSKDKLQGISVFLTGNRMLDELLAGEEGSSCCMWMQLLEKAYAAAGFNVGKPDIDEKGELHNLNAELMDGNPSEVLFHLTGDKYSMRLKDKIKGANAKPQAEISNDAKAFSLQKRMLFDGIPCFLHEPLYNELFKDGRDLSAYADKPDWELDYFKNAFNKVIDDSNKLISDIQKTFDQIKEEGKINEQEHQELSKLLESTYQNVLLPNWAADYPNKLLENIKNPSLQVLGQIDEQIDLQTLSDEIKEAIDSNNASFLVLNNILFDSKVYYDKIVKGTFTDEEKEQLQYATQNLFVPNPQEQYEQKELGYLREIREGLVRDKAVPLPSESGHVMTALDIRQHNNKWFVLIKDPFNTYRYEYTQRENGKLDKEFYGLTSAMYNHRSLKKLQPELKHGFMGTSWWELKDVYRQFKGNLVKTFE